MGATINARMGLNTWAAFTGTNDKAAIAGDVAMLESEVTPVLKALRKNGLDVVAIHHHMTNDRPMIVFLHYWGTGPAETLATGFKAAVNELGKHGSRIDSMSRIGGRPRTGWVRDRTVLAVATAALVAAGHAPASAQAVAPTLRAGTVSSAIVIDGQLSETAWASADAIEDFHQTDPVEGAPASSRTRVQVLADAKSIVIGIVCEEPDPSRIVSFSVRRDAVLDAEDHVRVVLGPFADGRSGYVFAVNPSGARYDGLINPGGEGDNPDWDGIWEAATARLPNGWSAEIRIPVLDAGLQAGSARVALQRPAPNPAPAGNGSLGVSATASIR